MDFGSIAIVCAVSLAISGGGLGYFAFRKHKASRSNGSEKAPGSNARATTPAMYADRTLAAVGTAVVFSGSVISIVTALFRSQDPHPFLPEAVALVTIAIVSAFMVFMRLFKALWIVVWSVVIVFAACLMTSLRTGLDGIPQEARARPLASLLEEKSLESVSLLFQRHEGWWVIAVGVLLLFWVAKNVHGRVFDVIPKSGPNLPVFSARTTTIIKAIIEAPKWPLMAGTVLILCGIIILISGVRIPLSQKLVGTIITELGFAFFIAFVIGLTIEIKSHADRDKQVSRGILSYVYGANLDENVFLAAEKYIFETPFYRRDLEITYNFMRASNGMLLLKYTISYAVTNVSRENHDYPIFTFVEKPSSGETSDCFPDVELGLQKIVVEGDELETNELEAARLFPDTDEYLQSNHSIPIGAGETKRIVCIHLLEKFERDAELWRSVVPCAGVTLNITWSEDLHLQMHAIAVHPADTQNSRHSGGFDTKSSDDNSLFAALYQPFFPFNGVYFWWERKPDPTSVKAPSTSERPQPSVPGASGGSEAVNETGAPPGESSMPSRNDLQSANGSLGIGQPKRRGIARALAWARSVLGMGRSERNGNG